MKSQKRHIMHSVRQLFLSTLMLVGLAQVANADDVSFTANAPRAVEVGEQFRLQFVLNAKGSNFNEPEISDFQVLSGPNTSTSSSIQWVNGNMSQSVSNTYTFILMAEKEGTFTIPSATIKAGGKTYQPKCRCRRKSARWRAGRFFCTGSSQ